MELLIPGLILVGLMVYASTRIKRIAAKAFEAETVENDEFALYKPEGLLHVLNGDPALAFEAYSKEFGPGDDSNIRAMRARIRVLDSVDFNKAVADVKRSVRVVSELSEIIGGAKCRLIEAEQEEDGRTLNANYKLIAAGKKTYEMRVLSLPETSDELKRKIERMIDSFSLK